MTNVNYSVFAGRIRFTSVNNNSARTAKHLLGIHSLTRIHTIYPKENHWLRKMGCQNNKVNLNLPEQHFKSLAITVYLHIDCGRHRPYFNLRKPIFFCFVQEALEDLYTLCVFIWSVFWSIQKYLEYLTYLMQCLYW